MSFARTVGRNLLDKFILICGASLCSLPKRVRTVHNARLSVLYKLLHTRHLNCRSSVIFRIAMLGFIDGKSSCVECMMIYGFIVFLFLLSGNIFKNYVEPRGTLFNNYARASRAEHLELKACIYAQRHINARGFWNGTEAGTALKLAFLERLWQEHTVDVIECRMPRWADGGDAQTALVRAQVQRHWKGHASRFAMPGAYEWRVASRTQRMYMRRISLA